MICNSTNSRYIVLFLAIFFSATTLYAQNNNTGRKSKERKNISKTSKDTLKTLKIMNNVLENVGGNSKSSGGGIKGMELDGLIMDETRTHIGRDFYDMYYLRWIPPKGINNYTIRIKEKMVPGAAVELTVMVNDVKVVQKKVQPRYEMLKLLVEYSNYETLRYLYRLQQVKSQLGGDDEAGSGIF